MGGIYSTFHSSKSWPECNCFYVLLPSAVVKSVGPYSIICYASAFKGLWNIKGDNTNLLFK